MLWPNNMSEEGRLLVIQWLDEMQEKDEKTLTHSLIVARICYQISGFLHFGEEVARQFYLAGLLHDLGAITGAADLPSEFSFERDARRKQIEVHVQSGLDLVQELRPYWVRNFVMLEGAISSHHERQDGGGFPKGLRNTEIPSVARMIAVAEDLEMWINPKSKLYIGSAKLAVQLLKTRSDQGVLDSFFVHPLMHMLSERNFNFTYTYNRESFN